MVSEIFGFLNVYKPVGITSHDVVAILRRITKIKQIGHTGTLDPFAQGVLSIAIGKSTRLIEFLDDDKEYLAEVILGVETNTYDKDGEIVSQCNLEITEPQITEALKAFEGEILQTPPIFSALKVKGKKLYEYARKGEDVKIEPRKITIEKIQLKDFNFETQTAHVLIKCSKGTYIRSIAHDLGQSLGCGAHLSKLVRTQAGKFFLENSIQLDELKTIQEVEKNLINPLDVIDLQQLSINIEEHQDIIVGKSIKNRENFNEGNFLILVYNENVDAISYVEKNEIKVKKVFGN